MIFLAGALYSQDSTSNQKNQYLTFKIGGGLQGLSYNLGDFGTQKSGWGISAHICYRYMISGNSGLQFGLMFHNFGNSATLLYTQKISGAIDDEGEEYQHRTIFNELEEKQKSNLVSIPLEYVFEQKISTKLSMDIGIGVVPMFVMGSTYETIGGNLETRAYYDRLDLEVFGLEYHHQYTAQDFAGSNTMTSSLGSIIECSLRYAISSNVDINFGVMGLYSLSSVSNSKYDNLYNPDCMSASAYNNAKYNGILNTSIADKCKPRSLGFMFGINYRIVK